MCEGITQNCGNCCSSIYYLTPPWWVTMGYHPQVTPIPEPLPTSRSPQPSPGSQPSGSPPGYQPQGTPPYKPLGEQPSQPVQPQSGSGDVFSTILDVVKTVGPLVAALLV